MKSVKMPKIEKMISANPNPLMNVSLLNISTPSSIAAEVTYELYI